MVPILIISDITAPTSIISSLIRLPLITLWCKTLTHWGPVDVYMQDMVDNTWCCSLYELHFAVNKAFVKSVNPLSSSAPYVQQHILVIIVPADGLAPNGARPSADTVLIKFKHNFKDFINGFMSILVDQTSSSNTWQEFGTSSVE